MRIPRELEDKLRLIRLEMKPTPHSVKVRRCRTSYADVQNREVVLAEKQLREVEWIYRHEVFHLDKYPRTLGRELYWASKIANRLSNYEASFFRKRRSEIMNMAEDAVIDYSLGRTYSDALSLIKKHAKTFDPDDDLPPYEAARLIAAGRHRDAQLEEMLESGDVVGVGVLTVRWLMRHPNQKIPRDLREKPNKSDFEEAAADLIREGEDLYSLQEFAQDEGVDWDFERAAALALVRSYDWYLSASRNRAYSKAGRAMQTVWSPGDSPERLDFYGSLTAFPKIIPGLTALKREAKQLPGFQEPLGFKDVALLVDESGSMRGLEAAVRRVGISILSLLNRRRVQYQIVSFGSSARVEVPLGFDYAAGVRYFTMYRGFGFTTNMAPALAKLKGRDLLVYVISDAEIYDLDRVAEYKHALTEVVLVLISENRIYEHFARALDGVRVRGYWLSPEKVDAFIVDELGQLA